MRQAPVVDVHQHLWPPELLDALRSRSHPPRLDGWTLHAPRQPPYDVDPSAHEPAKRAVQAGDDGVDRVVLSLSSPLGIEWLPDGDRLIDIWHDSALALGEPFAVWAAVSPLIPEAPRVVEALDRGCVGMQMPADALATPRHVEHAAPLLAACAERGKPVLVHPGATPDAAPADGAPDLPAWWAPVVGYTSQLAAAWWAWHAVGRQLLPTLRICFVAGAGLAPVHHERLAARGGRFGAVDPEVFVDTSSYGPRGLDAVIRVLGIDTVVLGSDRPYAEPTDPGLGDAATYAIRRTNPQRLLEGGER